ncbi:DUF91 domain-containing protein [Nocardioides sp. W3-2-3]|uniref:endonuclease NucS domain-containing protein n=1 Tax=Nocardioides convexus TaxID=2712224 RepID=UPI00241825B9|nr:endonuclease NucS domain-containing protein [Nocardioides convexus]NHA01941.1 DUF91 domain-containing protein [Nocardioides convexus]
MSEPQKESVLRDHLAQNLDLIESGLQLLKVEYAVKNPDGADGSIDILARDTSGDFVVIEFEAIESSVATGVAGA